MSDLVDAGDIEQFVGWKRHPLRHIGRAVSAEETVYILHSGDCLDSGTLRRDCAFSRALDRGIDLRVWDGWEDKPVVLGVSWGALIPRREAGADDE